MIYRFYIWDNKNNRLFLQSDFRDVAQSGLEYSSGGRGVGSSNLLIPTIITSLCKKTTNTALLSFLKQSFTYVNSLISKTSKASSLPFSYQRLKTRGFLADTN